MQYLEKSNFYKQKVQWQLPGAGKMGKRGSCCSVGIVSVMQNEKVMELYRHSSSSL
jgi:hypothetical protein